MLLITGGTGLVGSGLARLFLQQGEEVRVLARAQSSAEPLVKQGAQFMPGDVARLETLVPAMEGVSAVIHCVAIIVERGPYTFESVNVGGTRNVVQAAQAAGVGRLVHISALGAVNNPRLRYVYSKWRGEEAVRGSGLAWTILRPSVIVGPGTGFFDQMLRSIRILPPFAPVPGSGGTQFQPILVDDLARCVSIALKEERTVGQLYELGGSEQLTYDELLTILLRAVGKRRIRLHLPVPLMLPAAFLLDRLVKDPPVTPAQLQQIGFDNITDLDSVQRHFGFAPRALLDGFDELIAAKV